jgi:hypothetical protein
MKIRRARLAILAVPLAAFGLGLGCLGQAERTYFDDLIDGSADATAMARPDAATDLDATVPADAPGIVESDAGTDAGTDASPPAEDAAPDAPVVLEAGCGPTNTVTNCGTCGAACDTTHSVPSACTAGATCAYSACTGGWGDCDASGPNTNGCETPLDTATNCNGCGVACDTSHSVGAACGASGCTYQGCQPGWTACNTAAPNTGGCACNTPGCCGTGCQVTHDNGVGQPFYDCTPLGNYDASTEGTEAYRACTAFAPDGSTPVCSSGQSCATGPDRTSVYVCDQAALCKCWGYSGPEKGNVEDCSCPGVVIGTWN